jgi:hypothetical protein
MSRDEIYETVERMERSETDRRSEVRTTPERRQSVVSWVHAQNQRDIARLRNQVVMTQLGSVRVVDSIGFDFQDVWGEAR